MEYFGVRAKTTKPYLVGQIEDADKVTPERVVCYHQSVFLGWFVPVKEELMSPKVSHTVVRRTEGCLSTKKAVQATKISQCHNSSFETRVSRPKEMADRL
jgi:hypothetical protein